MKRLPLKEIKYNKIEKTSGGGGGVFVSFYAFIYFFMCGSCCRLNKEEILLKVTEGKIGSDRNRPDFEMLIVFVKTNYSKYLLHIPANPLAPTWFHLASHMNVSCSGYAGSLPPPTSEDKLHFVWPVPKVCNFNSLLKKDTLLV